METRQESYFEEFEVFSRKTQTAPVQYHFSLLAPNEDIAILMAQENFMRREAVDDIWVVKRQNIRKMNPEEKKMLQRLDNKDYRTTKGYGYLKKKWRKYEQEMLDEKEILSWAGGVKIEEIIHTVDNSAIKELLLQLADDDFIHSYRGSEWLGLAPHIEEDIASSSISQDTMGHAAMFYQLLEELGEGDANQLAHDRPANERRNAIILELVNGPGYYMEQPDYDWAFAVVRNYFYTQAKSD